MRNPSLHDLTLYVADIDASADFYRALGCDVFEYDDPEYTRHFDAVIGHTLLQLIPAKSVCPLSHHQLGLRVANLDAAAEALRAAGFTCEIPGPRRLRTTDPDGNRVHLTQVH